jgi:hypothetical protein
VSSEAKVSLDLADKVMRACLDNEIVSSDGAVDLDITYEAISSILDHELSDCPMKEEYASTKVDIVDAVLTSRYSNLYSLLRNHVSESTYLDLVKNKILCDVQGQDVLYQIFTCKILFKEAADEAPFFEFIQRVCSECESEDGCPTKVKAGT